MSQPIGPSMPTIGRIVHVEMPPVTMAAIVTAVTSSDGRISCTVFPPGSQPVWLTDVEHDEGGPYPTGGMHYKAGTWHWPPVTR